MKMKVWNTLLLCKIALLLNSSTIQLSGVENPHRNMTEFLAERVDKPAKTDIDKYTTALIQTVRLLFLHKKIVDTDVAFGLVLAKVHLTLTLKYSALTMSPRTRNIVKLSLTTCTAMLNDFEATLRTLTERDQKITELFINSDSWLEADTNFTDGQLLPLLSQDLQDLNVHWSRYIINTLSPSFTPQPAQSDECLELLSFEGGRGTHMHARRERRCELAGDCDQIMSKGEVYGYPLTHRLIYMMLSRVSNACYHVSPEADARREVALCALVLRDAAFLERNVYFMPDLFLEQIALCGTLGHTEFLRSRWLRRLLAWRSPRGCYADDWQLQAYAVADDTRTAAAAADDDTHTVEHVEEGKYPLKEKVRQKRHTSKFAGECDTHMTSLAIADLALTVRYLHFEQSVHNGLRAMT